MAWQLAKSNEAETGADSSLMQACARLKAEGCIRLTKSHVSESSVLYRVILSSDGVDELDHWCPNSHERQKWSVLAVPR